jgi:hypothetical protein
MNVCRPAVFSGSIAILEVLVRKKFPLLHLGDKTKKKKSVFTYSGSEK